MAEARSMALVNGTLYTGDAVFDDRAVVIEEGVVTALSGDLDPSRFPGEVIDMAGQRLAPGLIDLQVNGGADRLFNEAPSLDTLAAVAEAHERFGTTDLLATYLSGPASGLRAAAEAVRTAGRAGLTAILGLHSEGPLLNVENRGVHEAAWIRAQADQQLLEDLSGPARSGPTLVTLAPEVAPSGFVRALVERGAVVSAGHTAATSAQIAGAVEEGLRGGTHVWNGMPPVQARRPGPVVALLADPRIWCGFIADGHHVSPDVLTMSFAFKAGGRSVLVSDAMPPVGGSRDSFTLGATPVARSGTRCETADGRLAGGALPLIEGVRHCVLDLGVPIDEALRMATLYPAELLGIDGGRGRMAVGYPARIVALDARMSPSAVIVGTRFRRLNAAATADTGAEPPGLPGPGSRDFLPGPGGGEGLPGSGGGEGLRGPRGRDGFPRHGGRRG